jgi:hypothetical protein
LYWSDDYISGSPPWIFCQVRTHILVCAREIRYCCIRAGEEKGSKRRERERKKERKDGEPILYYVCSLLKTCWLVWMAVKIDSTIKVASTDSSFSRKIIYLKSFQSSAILLIKCQLVLSSHI